jgi:hypothetical protein
MEETRCLRRARQGARSAVARAARPAVLTFMSTLLEARLLQRGSLGLQPELTRVRALVGLVLVGRSPWTVVDALVGLRFEELMIEDINP